MIRYSKNGKRIRRSCLAMIVTMILSAYPGENAAPRTSDTAKATTVKGRLRIVPFRGAVEQIPKTCILDTTRMSGEDLYRYSAMPKASGPLNWDDALFLQEAIHYLTGIPKRRIPPTLPLVKEWIRFQGFRLYHLAKVEADALQAMIANGVYILVRMNRQKENEAAALANQTGSEGRGPGTHQPLSTGSPYFNVIKGYRPLLGAGGHGFKKGDRKRYLRFEMYDNAAAILSRHKTQGRKMVPFNPTTGASAYSSNSGLSKWGERAWLHDFYVIFPAKLKTSTFMDAVFERVPLSVKMPRLKELK